MSVTTTRPHDHPADAAGDAALIAASITDPAAFGAVFDRHVDAMYRYVALRIGPDLAEDVVSETFSTAFDRRASFRSDASSARPWLYGIAANHLARQREQERRWLERARLQQPEEPLDDTSRAHARLDARRLAPGLAAALLALRTGERDALLLHVFADMEPVEIARVLGIRRGAAKTRLSRARHHMRTMVEGEFDG